MLKIFKGVLFLLLVFCFTNCGNQHPASDPPGIGFPSDGNNPYTPPSESSPAPVVSSSPSVDVHQFDAPIVFYRGVVEQVSTEQTQTP